MRLSALTGPNAKAKRESTLAEEKRIYEKLVKPEFGKEPVTGISHTDIQAFVTKQTRKAKSNGRHCRNIIRQMMSYAVRLRLIEVNPAHDIAVVMPAGREKVLTDVELKAFWNACSDPASVKDLALSLSMGIALKMAAVVMQRGGEVIGMAFNEIDREARTWLIPAERMKGGKPHLVPLSDLALKLLDQAKAASPVEASAFVFPSPRSEDDRPMDRRAFSRAMARIDALIGLDGATPHDLRRTGATNLTSERIGIPRFIVSQVIAHASDTGGAAAVTGKHYDLNDYLPEKRRALDAWAALLEEIVADKERGVNVVRMARA